MEGLVDLNADRKRVWFQKLNDINDGIMINSIPLNLDFIDKNQV